MDILSSLNQKQRKAVTITRGPVLVIAGPGSGKTKCLTHRIAYLIQNKISPTNILAVTFTNKAAEEMEERVQSLVSLSSGSLMPTIGTFHAVCLRILRQQIEKLGKNYKKNFTIYDSADQISLIKRLIKNLEIDPEQFKPSSVQEAISKAKDELIDTKSYQAQAQDYFPQTIAKIYQTYQSALEKSNALDFDDLIMLTVNLFRKNPDILEKYQGLWSYILVDEAHDTNFSQYTLINMLAEKYKNIWLIADPDQSIYSWRGADFKNIINFENDYPEVKTILLEENYRSTGNILEASHYIISKNSHRKDKKLWTKNSEGKLIQLIETNNEEEEGSFITDEIENIIREKGLSLSDFTVLYRTNAQSRAIEEAFLKANFPYKIIGTVRFYERKEIKDILAYLKLVNNPDDSVSCQRIINLPPRRLAKFAKDIKEIDRLPEQPQPIKDFYQLIEIFRKESQINNLTNLIRKIIQEINYEEFIMRDREQGERRWENIKELFTVASKYDSIDPGLGLEKFLEDITLFSHHDEIENKKDLVNLMTLHCAKGLEFPVVFIAGCEEGIFPHSKSFFDPEQMEEERRLCYVGVTRAKKRAYLTFTRQRRLWGQVMVNPPSRFILDIPEYLVEFQEY